MWQELTKLWTEMQSSLSFWEAFIAMGFGLLFAVAVYLMYQLFYGSRHIGAGVHRTFLVGGPAITMIFLGIQSSIPLSLGLLGALSFVRFRTPVKDPAEIGFLLLLIASAIGAATGNFMVTSMLLVIVFLTLSVLWLTRNRVSVGGRGSLMISLGQPDFDALEQPLKDFLSEKLKGVELESMSVVDNRVNLQYQYKRQPTFDWTAFANELNQVTAPTLVEVFVS
jgi:hypothetical protein